MAFWGVEVKPGKPFTHCCENARARLRITQATLGNLYIDRRMTDFKTIIQCNVGERSPVFLGALLHDTIETCHLDLEFEEPDDVVFSVIGQQSVHLTGYYVQKTRQSNPRSDGKYDDSFINDGAELQFSPRSPVNNKGMGKKTPENDKPKDKNDHGGQHKTKYCVIESDGDAITREGEDEDDDKRAIKTATMSDDGKKDGVYHIEPKQKVECLDISSMYLHREIELPLDKEKTEVRNEKNELEAVDEMVLTGDTIYENSAKDTINQIQSLDFKKPRKKRKQRSKKKDKTCNIQTDNANMAVGENSEDGKKLKTRNELEVDGINTEGTIKKCQNVLKDDEKSEDGSQHVHNLTRLAEICTEEIHQESHNIPEEDISVQILPHDESAKEDLPAETGEYQDRIIDNIINTINKGTLTSDSQSKKKAKKRKKKTQDEKVSSVGLTNTMDSKETTPKNAAPISKRILSNGLIIEELVRGPPDGKAAVSGKKVKIFYTAMLKETGHVFESNVGNTAYVFQLGDENIIDGWNVGIDGMRVGDKRRLIIPPSMSFGDQGIDEDVPPNSWLVYEIELVGVRK